MAAIQSLQGAINTWSGTQSPILNPVQPKSTASDFPTPISSNVTLPALDKNKWTIYLLATHPPPRAQCTINQPIPQAPSPRVQPIHSPQSSMWHPKHAPRTPPAQPPTAKPVTHRLGSVTRHVALHVAPNSAGSKSIWKSCVVYVAPPFQQSKQLCLFWTKKKDRHWNSDS